MKRIVPVIALCVLIVHIAITYFVPRTSAQDISYSFSTGWASSDSLAYTFQAATISTTIQPNIFDWEYYPNRDAVNLSAEVTRDGEKLPLYIAKAIGAGAPGSGIEDRITIVEFTSFIPSVPGEYFVIVNGTLNNIPVYGETVLYVVDSAAATFPSTGRVNIADLQARITNLEDRLFKLESALTPGS